MSKLRVPSYRHHRPSGQAVVTLDGVDFYLGKWNTKVSRIEYDRLIGEWLANGRCLPSQDDKADLRICELMASYLDFAKDYYADDGKPGKEYVCMRDVAKPLGKLYSRSRDPNGKGIALTTTGQQTLRLELSDGKNRAGWDRNRGNRGQPRMALSCSRK